MGSDKIFMFDNPAAGESAGIMSMIPALLQNKGLDPNLVAALMKQFNVELKNDVEYNKVYVLNMVRADYMGSSIVNEQYACMFVKDYLDDVDGSPTRALDEYYAKCIACGTPFSWEDYI